MITQPPAITTVPTPSRLTNREGPAAARAESRATPWQSAWLLGQVVLAALVVHTYDIEGGAFLRVFGLATAGFAVTLVLPLPARLPFFVALSWAGAFLVFGVADALWLIGCGLALIGVCHLPASFTLRSLVLVIAVGLLAASRASFLPAPWSPVVWPILGSMFMFRLVLYMLAMKNATGPPQLTWAFAYFFMLPNLVFALFPVVDFQTFRRTYYDKAATAIHEQGIAWIARGLVHLLLYRFVYHNVLNDPIDVIRLSGVVQFMLGTFLLYLRVSGQFHLIVGMLHLFGFRLPETHKLYYLAHSFTELWRRINIYWTDFMMKTVFYPVYFKVKRFGPLHALVISTAAVFITTWILHSYQWFWLRGGFPLTLQDTLFWGLLGALVIRGAVRESRAVRKPRSLDLGWDWRLGLRAAATFSLFCLLWSLWSTDSVSEWVWMIAAAGNVDLAGVALATLVIGTVFLLGGRNWEVASQARSGWRGWMTRPDTRAVASLLLLMALAQPGAEAVVPGPVAEGLRSLHESGLNTRDAALQNRGYYEQLDVRGQLNERVLDAIDSRSAHWTPLASTGLLHERRSDMLTRDLYPSKSVVWNGKQVTTNSWGMRDQEYSKVKPPGVFRIAIVGPSLVMGSGIADGETFESIVETRLNEELKVPGWDQFEILNFGVEGHAMPEQVAMLEDRVFEFDPDIVIAVLYHPTRWWTERYVRKIVWDRVEIRHESLRALLARSGLDQNDGDISVPFSIGRRLARQLGLHPRMPTGESAARIRWITDDFVDWSILRFAEVATAHGVRPVLLALNAVIDDVPKELPHLPAVRASGVPVIDLFHIYPDAEKSSLRVAEWDEHPNAVGHRLIADRLYGELVTQINSVGLGTRR